MNSTISSKTARVGDTFTANVTEPVYSNNGVLVIPERQPSDRTRRFGGCGTQGRQSRVRST